MASMKLALGMMITAGEAPYLRLHLPVIAQCFDGFVFALDPTENIKAEENVLRDYSPRLELNYRFNNNWSDQLNRIIQRAEMLGYDALLRLDPDEAMFSHDVDTIRTMLEQFDVLTLARYNFWLDRLHYDATKYPDWQTRAFKLNCGAHYEGQHHETLRCHNPYRLGSVPDAAIFHYGWVGKQRILDKDFHYLQIAREKAGLPPLAERPADREFPHWDSVEYTGQQPVDPYKVGIYAPYKE